MREMQEKGPRRNSLRSRPSWLLHISQPNEAEKAKIMGRFEPRPHDMSWQITRTDSGKLELRHHCHVAYGDWTSGVTEGGQWVCNFCNAGAPPEICEVATFCQCEPYNVKEWLERYLKQQNEKLRTHKNR